MENTTKGIIASRKEENLSDVDEALMFETNGKNVSMFMDYSKLSEDTKFKRLRRD